MEEEIRVSYAGWLCTGSCGLSAPPCHARGLEDQLLASVVGAEQPALEKTKNDLVQVLWTTYW